MASEGSALAGVSVTSVGHAADPGEGGVVISESFTGEKKINMNNTFLTLVWYLLSPSI